MKNLDAILHDMTFEFFGGGKHKIEAEALLSNKAAIFLDLRSRSEWESIQFKLEHHLKVLWIPTEEIPERYNELPREAMIGLFCTSGTRSAMVYFYLLSKGYQNVRIISGGYDSITNLLMPGKLLKSIKERKTA